MEGGWRELGGRTGELGGTRGEDRGSTGGSTREHKGAWGSTGEDGGVWREHEGTREEDEGSMGSTEQAQGRTGKDGGSTGGAQGSTGGAQPCPWGFVSLEDSGAVWGSLGHRSPLLYLSHCSSHKGSAGGSETGGERAFPSGTISQLVGCCRAPWVFHGEGGQGLPCCEAALAVTAGARPVGRVLAARPWMAPSLPSVGQGPLSQDESVPPELLSLPGTPWPAVRPEHLLTDVLPGRTGGESPLVPSPLSSALPPRGTLRLCLLPAAGGGQELRQHGHCFPRWQHGLLSPGQSSEAASQREGGAGPTAQS